MQLIVDTDAREVRLGDHVIPLTKIEFDLLATLARHPRTVMTNEQLSRSALGNSWYTGAHSIAVHIGHIRKKLGESGDCPGFIVNKRGVGYMFDPDCGTGATERAVGSEVILTYNESMVLISVEPAEPFFGWRPEDVIGTDFLLASEEVALSGGVESVLRSLMAAGTREFTIDANVHCADGSRARARMENRLQVDERGQFRGLVGRVAPLS